MSDVAAIVLAAGRGSRFGAEPKLLAVLGGKPLVRHVAEAASGASVGPVLVVTGYKSPGVEAALADLPVRVIHNPSFADGLSSSLKVAFAALPPGVQAAVVLLGDMPLITPDLIDTLVSAWHENQRPVALIPTLDGRRGNPVVLSRTLEPSIGMLSGDAGAGAILRARPDVLEWPVTDGAVLQDVDTRDDLEGLQT